MAREGSMNIEDLGKITEELLRECPACDLGLPYVCVCPPAEFDFRPVMANLVTELERHRAHEERAARALSEIEHFQGMTRKDLARVILRVEEHLRNAEAQLSQYEEELSAFEEFTSISRKQVTHVMSCPDCDYDETGVIACVEYREIDK